MVSSMAGGLPMPLVLRRTVMWVCLFSMGLSGGPQMVNACQENTETQVQPTEPGTQEPATQEPATQATSSDQQMQYPIDVAVDSQGVLYVADRNLPGIWKVVDGKPEIFFQAEKKYRTPLNAIRSLAVDRQDRVLAGCSTTTEVYRFVDGKPLPLTGGQVSVPMNLCVDAAGRILVCDLKMRTLLQIDAEQPSVTELLTLSAPKAVAAGENKIMILTGVEDPLMQSDNDGKNPQALVKGRPFNFPADVVAWGDAWVVSDSYERCLWKVAANGEVEKWVSDERFVLPVGLAADDQFIYLADSRANTIFKIDAAGTVTAVVSGKPAQ